jgi:hypothetical protein
MVGNSAADTPPIAEMDTASNNAIRLLTFTPRIVDLFRFRRRWYYVG